MLAHRKRIVGPRGKEPVTVGLRQQRSCRGRGAHVLRGGPRGQLQARRILRGQDSKGNQARRLPVEQPTKFEFVINLKTAKQIGLTIPPEVLARATRVIK